jgi:predicted MFS family arabinose efflux permease
MDIIQDEQIPIVESNRKSVSKCSDRFTLIILFSLNFLNYTDRYLISSVLIDIQDYFDLSKSTAGLLQTIFLVSFLIVAPVVGVLGDIYKRRYLLLICCLLWFSSVFSSSFVSDKHFYLFVLTRVVFGAASAFYECIALPIISDLSETNTSSRTRNLFLFYLGPPLGTGFAYVLANTIRQWFPNDWRFVLRFTPGLILILLILIMLFFHEQPKCLQQSSQSSLSQCINELLRNRTYIRLVIASSCIAASLVGFNWWSPTFISYILKSNVNVDAYEYKQLYAGLQTVFGMLGTLISSELSNWMKNKNKIFDIDVYLLSVFMLISSVTLYIFLVISSWHPISDIVVYSLFNFFINTWRILVANILLDIVDSNRRATANSILLFFIHLFGDSFAPYWIGLINDQCIHVITRTNNNRPTTLTLLDMYICTQISLYPLVFLLFIAASLLLFSSFTFHLDKK